MPSAALDPSFGYVRIACIAPELRLAAPSENCDLLVAALEDAAAAGARIAVLPELAITGYTVQDLFYQAALQHAARETLLELAKRTAALPLAYVVGVPLALEGRLFNCAAFIQGGRICGIVPKTYLPCTGEFYEQRWFTSGRQQTSGSISLGGEDIPFGVDIVFAAENEPLCKVGIEICEDLWAVTPPSGALALAGCSILLNPSASNELLGKMAYRRDLVQQQSARCFAAYAYASAGAGESSTDLVYSGHLLVAENGQLLAACRNFSFATDMIFADVDLQRLELDRQRNSSWSEAPREGRFRSVSFTLPPSTGKLPLERPLTTTPFVPGDLTQRAAHCQEIFAIQSVGLARRVLHTGSHRVVLGLSGGLDSTLALLVCCHAFDRLELPRDGILCVTMPGPGTSKRTKNNACDLAAGLGVDLLEVSISSAVEGHLRDLSHPLDSRDVTFENAQARERTQILMDLANKEGGFVVGTGDMSEAALGWCTFNGDHMSMYHVNAGVPKTMVQYVIGWCAEEMFQGRVAEVLEDVIATPISPELLPGDEEGCMQETECAIGPYLLHDFFLYHLVRMGFAPRKIRFLAQQAFKGQFDNAAVERWLQVFIKRFFGQQYKRSAMPDGPKVGTVALSPRGDWRMPSDALWTAWLQDFEKE